MRPRGANNCTSQSSLSDAGVPRRPKIDGGSRCSIGSPLTSPGSLVVGCGSSRYEPPAAPAGGGVILLLTRSSNSAEAGAKISLDGTSGAAGEPTSEGGGADLPAIRLLRYRSGLLSAAFGSPSASGRAIGAKLLVSRAAGSLAAEYRGNSKLPPASRQVGRVG